MRRHSFHLVPHSDSTSSRVLDPQGAGRCEDRGQLSAYAQVRRHAPPECVRSAAPVELWRFYVDRSWQGRGLAQRLMSAALAAARELGGRSLWLSVWERNPRAIAYYAKSGFRDLGTADFWVGSDRQTDRIMALDLGPSDPQ